MEWISCEDRYPSPDEWVLGFINDGQGTTGHEIVYCHNKKFYDSKYELPITHWMPLPEPPKY
ncbi:DUF551 domain-containing protein [Acinetobacter baumannii]|uniref:DUF551 domain-containing protein n=1 Tax=Acinetobacter baumannii TaxID=470 RepID=UPI00070FB388|nr:DUF551 domain-containing protein [Acinetobacter baumannii]KRI87840.1 hypothetical protein APC70_04425 [Acinetobacter baumannii]KRI92257.1 hypothetical protein APC70_10160 [Acinetobacter baumannii]MDH2662942.1 DUF551 domain-containing protein [Acinetobacter baumannii]